jgi:NifU-like protein
MWNYTDKVREHFFNPHNVGNIENPDAVGNVGSLACGDALKLMLKIDKKDNERIVEAKFQTFGCASAIASASALTDMIIGKTLAEVAEITNRDIADFLGGLPEQKMHCSVMGRDALEAAVANYRGVKAPVAKHEHAEETNAEIVCKCFGVSETEIRRTVRENDLRSVEQITNYTKAGGGCGQCKERIQEILDSELGQKRERETKPKRLTNVQKMRLIEDAFEREIRPALRADGGDIELVDVDGDRVTVALLGMCVNCPASGNTINQYVEKKLRDLVHPDLFVEEAKT